MAQTTREYYLVLLRIDYRGCCGIGNMEELDIDCRLDHRCNDMHGLGAQHDDLGTGRLKNARILGRQRPSRFPVTGILKRLDCGEVVAADDKVGRVRPAEPNAHTSLMMRSYSMELSQLIPPSKPMRFTRSPPPFDER